MNAPKFSWMRAIASARSSGSLSPNESLRVLRKQLAINPLQGFELELLGRFLQVPLDLDEAEWPELRVAIVATTATQPLANAARVALLAEGYQAAVYEAPFGAHRQEILVASSGLYEFRPDVIVVAVGAPDVLSSLAPTMSSADVEALIEGELSQWRGLWRELAAHSDAAILQHTLVAPEHSLLGIAERKACWSSVNVIAELNRRAIEAAPKRVAWVDIDQLSANVGRSNWHDPRLEYHGKFGFAIRYLPEYAALLGAAMRSALGRAPKALILDLDNTLWGGVIGDDGLEGIHLGPDSAEGEAYQAFCGYIRSLGQRGIILGICSKNDTENVNAVFESHPHMPLKREDFSVYKCNWNDKATNLAAIAQELNIGISALVFVDDNPAECELIRQLLPSVRVIHLDGDPALFVRRLDRERLFDSQHLSAEDLTRTESYQARVKAAELKIAAPDLESYLRSLEMRADVRFAGPAELPRLAQMEMKTNQFNLSTRRLNQEQLQAMTESPDMIVVAALLEDRFTNHGLVAYVAAKQAGSELTITDWLMSCRVFSRTLEHCMMRYLIEIAQPRGVETISLEFIPTAKNSVMERLFKELGFQCEGAPPRGPWQFQVKSDQWPKSFIRVGQEDAGQRIDAKSYD